MEKLFIYVDGDGGVVVLTWGKKEENKVFVVSDSALLVIADTGHMHVHQGAAPEA